MTDIKITIKRNDIKKVLGRLKPMRVVAGLPAGSGSYEGGESVVSVGVANEFGVKGAISYQGHRIMVEVDGIPERPFMRPAAQEGRQRWASRIYEDLPLVFDGSVSTATMMDGIGSTMESDIKQKIVDTYEPPNSKQVIYDKGSSHPLIDTGRMIGAITHEVRR